MVQLLTIKPMQNNEIFAENPNFENAPLIRIELNEEGRRVVSARELHAFLEVKTRFNDWIIRRIVEYRLLEGIDFAIINFDYSKMSNQKGGDRKSQDYALTLNTAKELAMVENNEQGKQARRYFLWCEENLQNLPTLSLPTVGKAFL
jgi:anti-repressor protein